MPTWDNPLITIIGEKCRMCYACVRECPAKAIQVVDGQARVIQPRCIGCGNCLRVCSQNAKQVRDDTARAFGLLQSRDRVVAMVAPSFPAEFADIPPGTLVAMIRALGFDSVHEVTLGADLVAGAYRDPARGEPGGPVHHDALSGGRLLRSQIPSPPDAVPRPHRLPDGGHGPRAPSRSGAGHQGRLHGTVRGQETRLHRHHSRGGRRGPHVRRAPRHVPQAGHHA